MLQINESQNGQEIEWRRGEKFEIHLSENPTTGFRWAMESRGAPACALVEDRYQPSDAAPGAGGTHRWQFQATQAGEARIELNYRRSWDRQGAAARTFTLRVRVTQ